MSEYELRLRFTAADDAQAFRLGNAWADTCAAEYATREGTVWAATSVGWARLTEDTFTVKYPDERRADQARWRQVMQWWFHGQEPS